MISLYQLYGYNSDTTGVGNIADLRICSCILPLLVCF